MSNNVGLGSREWFHFYNLIIPWRLFNFLLHFFDFCGEEIYQWWHLHDQPEELAVREAFFASAALRRKGKDSTYINTK
ncbi:hypothetical protein HPB47_000277 [Ixodes persulcatus]|uniref:Uncharacterized protein n=1 Tax=Ixodes persulcatus TaxID=34615 RepID=A0AC60PS68_IXOPE|nr:hypothetical protein HPB47_000277 [Ixodes persulcatus]